MEFVTHPPSNAARRLLSGFASALVVVLLTACEGSPNSSNQSSLRLSYQPVKTFHFEWDAVAGAERYQLLENPDGQSGFGDGSVVIEVPASQLSANLEVPLYNRLKASYLLRSCAGNNCETVAQVAVSKPEALTPAIGELRLDKPLAGSYFGGVYLYTKQEDGQWQTEPERLTVPGGESEVNALFGASLSLDQQGLTLAVGAPSSRYLGLTPGIVYLYQREENAFWEDVEPQSIQVADTEVPDEFGSVSLSADGQALAVGAPNESGIGAAYIFAQTATNAWEQQARVQAATTTNNGFFGFSVGLSGDGKTLVVGEHHADEDKGRAYLFEQK